MTRSPQAAGSLLALSIIVGAVAGTILGQPSVGVVAGTAIGILISVVVWLRDRSR